MPQIYYGFKNEYAPFELMINKWLELCVNKNIKVVPVLAIYKSGVTDSDAGSGKTEWIDDKNVIEKQIVSIKSRDLSGYSLFRYDFIK